MVFGKKRKKRGSSVSSPESEGQTQLVSDDGKKGEGGKRRKLPTPPPQKPRVASVVHKVNDKTSKKGATGEKDKANSDDTLQTEVRSSEDNFHETDDDGEVQFRQSLTDENTTEKGGKRKRSARSQPDQGSDSEEEVWSLDEYERLKQRLEQMENSKKKLEEKILKGKEFQDFRRKVVEQSKADEANDGDADESSPEVENKEQRSVRDEREALRKRNDQLIRDAEKSKVDIATPAEFTACDDLWLVGTYYAGEAISHYQHIRGERAREDKQQFFIAEYFGNRGLQDSAVHRGDSLTSMIKIVNAVRNGLSRYERLPAAVVVICEDDLIRDYFQYLNCEGAVGTIKRLTKWMVDHINHSFQERKEILPKRAIGLRKNVPTVFFVKCNLHPNLRHNGLRKRFNEALVRAVNAVPGYKIIDLGDAIKDNGRNYQNDGTLTATGFEAYWNSIDKKI